MKANLGKMLFEGQVWLRRGTKNTVARHAELQRMFRGVEPFKIGRLSADGSDLAPLQEHYAQRGREICRPRFGDRDTRLAQGHELAYWPGTRREVWVGGRGDTYEHIVMLKPLGK